MCLVVVLGLVTATGDNWSFWALEWSFIRD